MDSTRPEDNSERGGHMAVLGRRQLFQRIR
jgi:hypothetical protein